MDRVAAIVIMGVTGAGKTTVGKELAERLGRRFCEGDSFHSAANVTKMRNGEPLDNADRAPWLAAMNAMLRTAADDATPVVLACSALKRSYRRRLTAGLAGVEFVYLHGPSSTLRERVDNRRDHFMVPALLDSQVESLEEPDHDEALWVKLDQPVAKAVDQILKGLSLQPQEEKPGP